MSQAELIFASNDRTKTIGLMGVVLVGLLSVVLLARWIDTKRPPADPNTVDESLYLNGQTARRISLGFNGLAADWYWMRSLQYVGGKIINMQGDVVFENLEQLNLKLLPSLLDTATTLDPEFFEPYEYAAAVLPAVDADEAVRIVKKGVATKPLEWRLYQHLGYLYWQKKDYQAAAETYDKATQIPGTPKWLEAMKARMLADGGSRATAREVYLRMYEQSSDPQVREMANNQVLRLDAMDQMEVLQKILATFQTRNGRCITTWKEVQVEFRTLRIPVDATGAPLDPSRTPYLLGANCNVQLSPQSEVPKR